MIIYLKNNNNHYPFLFPNDNTIFTKLSLKCFIVTCDQIGIDNIEEI